jgi:hypothetical protein
MKEKKSGQTKSKPSIDTPRHLPEWLLDETETLKEMIEWWKSRESTALNAIERRPVFLGKTKNSGIRINEVILERAMNKARQERLRTGGNLSQLVEWLLWIYIGSPADIVEKLQKSD